MRSAPTSRGRAFPSEGVPLLRSYGYGSREEKTRGRTVSSGAWSPALPLLDPDFLLWVLVLSIKILVVSFLRGVPSFPFSFFFFLFLFFSFFSSFFLLAFEFSSVWVWG